MRIRFKNCLFIAFFFTSSAVIGQSQIVLTCTDSSNSNFQFNVSFDVVKRTAEFAGEVYKNAVTNDSISYDYKDAKNGTIYQTIIYRDTGRFTVFTTGSTTFNFGGNCVKKLSNKF